MWAARGVRSADRGRGPGTAASAAACRALPRQWPVFRCSPKTCRSPNWRPCPPHFLHFSPGLRRPFRRSKNGSQAAGTSRVWSRRRKPETDAPPRPWDTALAPASGRRPVGGHPSPPCMLRSPNEKWGAWGEHRTPLRTPRSTEWSQLLPAEAPRPAVWPRARTRAPLAPHPFIGV